MATTDRSDLDRVVAGLIDSATDGPLGPVLAEWDRSRSDSGIPFRKDFDPARVTEWLSYLAILQVEDEGRDFKFRLTGTRMDLYLGRNLTGQWVSAVPNQGEGSAFWKLLQNCVADQQPAAGRIEYENAREMHQDCTALMLPWRTAPSAPDQVLVVQDFRLVPAGQAFRKV